MYPYISPTEVQVVYAEKVAAVLRRFHLTAMHDRTSRRGTLWQWVAAKLAPKRGKYPRSSEQHVSRA